MNSLTIGNAQLQHHKERPAKRVTYNPVTGLTDQVPAMPLDSALSSSSTNPVQNKAVSEAIIDLINKTSRITADVEDNTTDITLLKERTNNNTIAINGLDNSMHTLNDKVNSNTAAISNEVTRATGTEAVLQQAINTVNTQVATKQDALSAVQMKAVNSGITAELVAQIGQGIPVDSSLDTDSTNPVQNKVLAKLIPAQANEQNKLADKNFVNSSIGTNTAHYISDDGEPFTSVADLEAYTGEVTPNDYAFVTGTDSDGNVYFDRYKADVDDGVVTWAKEYRLNNSSFTAEQWAAISSGITAELVAQIGQGGAGAVFINLPARDDWEDESVVRPFYNQLKAAIDDDKFIIVVESLSSDFDCWIYYTVSYNAVDSSEEDQEWINLTSFDGVYVDTLEVFPISITENDSEIKGNVEIEFDKTDIASVADELFDAVANGLNPVLLEDIGHADYHWKFINNEYDESVGAITGYVFLCSKNGELHKLTVTNNSYQEIAVAQINDATTGTTHTWSSSKINTQIETKQNKVTASTTDLTAGVSPLATGELYLVYEV